MGYNYLFKAGITSIFSAMKSKKKGYNPDDLITHKIFGVGMDADRRAAAYFKKYGVV